MRLKSIRIVNFECFEDTRVIDLDPGFNLVVGQNNSGKSALLRALTLRANGSPHLSLQSKPTPSTYVRPTSTMHVELDASGEDFRAAIFSIDRGWLIPVPRNVNVMEQSTLVLWEQLVARDSIKFACHLRADNGASPAWLADRYPCLNAYPVNDSPDVFTIAPNRETGTARFQGGSQVVGLEGDSGVSVAQQIARNVYKFDAERLNVSRTRFDNSKELAPNAANLAEVLSSLRENGPAYEAYVGLVSEVFPSITSVAIRALPNQQIEITVWQTPRELERADLAIPLERCGTGIGQVLAILYVVKTSITPRTIIIDEPNSFLHPGACRALIRILKKFRQHQYVVSTHSAEVISEIGAAKLLHTKFADGKSTVTQYDKATVGNTAGILGDLGARLSDVLGYDRVIWVEGPSDAEVFSDIAASFSDRYAGYVFLPVRSTSTFYAVDLTDVLDLYRKLSMGAAPVPPQVRFAFDREGRTDQELRDLRRASEASLGTPMYFLQRRMLENYFLRPAAIAAVINEFDKLRVEPVSAELVETWFADNGADGHYEAGGHVPGTSEWTRQVHAWKFIDDAMLDLTESRCEYRKTTHGPWLAAWFAKHHPEDLAELRQLVRQLLDLPAA